MKKIIIVLYLISIVGISGLFFYGLSKPIKMKYYTIRENLSYVYEKGRKMTFNVYSEANNPMIIYPEYNAYTLRLDNLSFTLENVRCDLIKSTDINVIKISADMPELTDSEIISKSCILDIINGEYSLKLDVGTFSMINSKYYENLMLDNLSGSFSSVNGYFNLVGINIGLSSMKEYMKEFRIGGYSFGILSKIKSRVSYESEINIYDVIPDYIETKIDNNYVFGIKDKEMFIPIGYKMSYLTRSGYIVVEFEDKKFYFDNFPFMTTDPVYSKYNKFLTEGVIYA
ncbi:MAG: hypothetical protein IKP77_07375 [Acholeplasmatales bacterium]|nr:hypothetical protein [Acholeplasmatales bacterium]